MATMAAMLVSTTSDAWAQGPPEQGRPRARPANTETVFIMEDCKLELKSVAGLEADLMVIKTVVGIRRIIVAELVKDAHGQPIGGIPVHTDAREIIVVIAARRD